MAGLKVEHRNFRLTFLVNHAAFFVSHRLPIATAAQTRGIAVDLVTGQAESPIMEAAAEPALVMAGISHRRAAFRSSGLNPITELLGLVEVIVGFVRRKPDIVHCASPKGLLYGGIAARLSRVPALVLAVSGLGFAFTTHDDRSALRRFSAFVYRNMAHYAFGHPNLCVIVQNETDRQFMLENGLATLEQIRLIAGSGVDLSKYATMSFEAKLPIILVPARMVRDKGIYEIAEAARSLRGSGWRIILAGTADYRNPSSISFERLRAWQTEGILEWIGHVSDMEQLYRSASIVCLPSYREGMPKALLEAAAAGCAVVTTNAVGCRDAIIPGETGDLVPVRDAQALTNALARLIADRAGRECYGRAGRNLAFRSHGIESVVRKTLDIYDMLLAEHAGSVNDQTAHIPGA